MAYQSNSAQAGTRFEVGLIFRGEVEVMVSRCLIFLYMNLYSAKAIPTLLNY